MFTGVRFGRVPPYHQNVICSVEVAMTNETAIRAKELSFAERHLCDSSASAARLACEPGIDFHHLRTACYSFVFQASDEGVPGSVAYTFSEAMILKHPIDIQVFDCDERKRFSEPIAELMQEISPLVSDLDVLFSESEHRFSSISGTLLFFAEPPLQQLESLLGFEEMPRVIYEFSVGEDSVTLNPNIQPNLFNGRMFNFRCFDFASESSEPLSCSVLFDGESLDFSSWYPVKDYGNRTDFADPEPLIAEHLETGLWERNAVHSALEPRETFFAFRCLRVLDSPKEVLERFADPIRNILLRLGMYLRVFAIKIIIEIKFVQRNLTIFPGINGDSEKLVIDCFASLKRISYPALLFMGRINTISIHPEFHTKKGSIANIYSLRSLTAKSLIHPTAKAVGILRQNHKKNIGCSQ